LRAHVAVGPEYDDGDIVVVGLMVVGLMVVGLVVVEAELVERLVLREVDPEIPIGPIVNGVAAVASALITIMASTMARYIAIGYAPRIATNTILLYLLC